MSLSPTYFQLHQTAEAFVNSYNSEDSGRNNPASSSPTALEPESPWSARSSSWSSGSAGLHTSDRPQEETHAGPSEATILYTPSIREIVVDEVQRKVAIRAAFSPILGGSLPKSPTLPTEDHIFLLTMRSDGKEITRINHLTTSTTSPPGLSWSEDRLRDDQRNRELGEALLAARLEYHGGF